MSDAADPRDAFMEAATWHGELDQAEAMLKAHPQIAEGSIHVAAILGDDAAVRRFIAADPSHATARAGPYQADALNYLGLSKYLRFDRSRTSSFVRAATALLDAGADPNTGFWNNGEFETAMYGAAGVAHHPELTRLLLERGADPNDGEVVYHSPESGNNDAMKLVVETGRVTPENLLLMLIRKHDWHDYDGAKWLLEHGADPNLSREGGWPLPIHHGITRDNDLEMIELLLDHGANPEIRARELTAVERAALRGRGDLLALFEKRGINVELQGIYRLIAACARHDEPRVRAIAAAEPELVRQVLAGGGRLLAEFAGTWNTRGVGLLLDLGVPVAALYEGDGYFGIPENSSALHVAAWKGVPSTIKLLLDRGAQVNAKDGRGRTPLMLAVKACVDSYWTERRSPEPTRMLLEAGAAVEGVQYPSGYAEVDVLLKQHQP